MPDDTVSRVKEKWPIVRFFQEELGVQFQGTGEQLTGLCPFHNDTSPSLAVNTKQNLWHCYGACERGGDLLTAIQVHLGYGFKDSLYWAAGKLGISVEAAPRSKGRPPLSRAIPEYHASLRQNPEAMTWLTDPKGRRGFSEATIIRFRLGHEGEFYTIPLPNEAGTDENLKLVHPDKGHTPRQFFLHKGKAKLWFPAPVVKAQSELVAVGGEWDVIRMQQEGFANAVCWVTGEGGLTREVAEAARGKRVILLLDADQTGKAAARRSTTLLRQSGASVLVVDWTEGAWGKDATDYLKEYGAPKLKELLAQATEPRGGIAYMGGFSYWEDEEGYSKQAVNKKDSQPIPVTNFIVRYHAIWKPADNKTPPTVEGAFHCRDQTVRFHWPVAYFTDSKEFKAHLPEVLPFASYAIHHIAEILPVLPQLNEGCPVYSSVTGPGYAGDTWVSPSILVRQGKALLNAGQVHVVNDSPAVRAYDLAMPSEDKKAAREALMNLLCVHDYSVTVPMMAHFVSAPALRAIGGSPYCLYISGPTGAGKTMLAKCMLNLFMPLNPLRAEEGKLLSAHSTVTSLELIGWHVQDAPIVIDDLKAGVSDMNALARAIHSHYDAWGRSRARPNLELHQGYFIRGLLAITGEQLPNIRGYASVLRRGLVLEVPPDGLDLSRPTAVFRDSELLRGMTASWIAWTQAHEPPIDHAPTPPSTAERFAQQTLRAWNWFMQFARAELGLDAQDAESLTETAEKAFGFAVSDSLQEMATSEAHTMFINAIKEGLAAGRLTLEVPKGSERRIGCRHRPKDWPSAEKVCLFPGEAVRWTKEVTGLELSTPMMGRTLKAHGLLHIDRKRNTPTTNIALDGSSVAVWMMQDSIDLVSSERPLPAEQPAEQPEQTNPFIDA